MIYFSSTSLLSELGATLAPRRTVQSQDEEEGEEGDEGDDEEGGGA